MKKKLVILSAAAMVAAAAVPALAFENEFHGMYRLRAIDSNYEINGLAATATTIPAGQPLLLAPDSTRSYMIFEQRARLQYIAKASDDLKLVTHFEIDSTWGDAAFTNGRGLGGGLAGDTVNLETKNVYLDFNIPSAPVNMKVGLQGFSDAYKGVFINDDAAGAVATGKFGALTTTAGFFRLVDNNGVYGSLSNSAAGTPPAYPTATSNTTGNALGKQTLDMYLLDAKFAINKDLSVGGSYYFVHDDLVQNGQVDGMHMLGLNAAAKIGIVDVDGFFLYQTGNEIYNQIASGANTSPSTVVFNKLRNVDAYAAQLAAKVNLGTAGTFRAAGLYASGNDGKNSNHSNAFQSLFDTNSSTYGTSTKLGNSSCAGNYYSADMKLLFRNVVNMDTDNGIVGSLNNTDQGVQAAFLGYDFKFNDKLSATANAGMAFVDKKNAGSTKRAQGNAIGTELNAQVNYALYPALTASVQVATVMLGNYYNNAVTSNTAKPSDPYLAGLMLNYGF